MKPATIKQLKDELKTKDSAELVEICLNLAKFKKESKEFLSYLLFLADDEQEFIREIKDEVTLEFSQMNVSSYYFMKKTARKTLRFIKKNIRFSKKKETEIELLMHFCFEMKRLSPNIRHNTVMTNMYSRQLLQIKKRLAEIHPDLRYDYELELETFI